MAHAHAFFVVVVLPEKLAEVTRRNTKLPASHLLCVPRPSLPETPKTFITYASVPDGLGIWDS
eukprot:scaffold48_cov311-Pinguiococcus_pyrenoidosus.AAC.298